jgi:O-antigen/teichoic acid export membrane protein
MSTSKIDIEATTAHSSAKRVVKNTGFLYLRMAITVFISLYVTRLLLGSLGAEDFGIYHLVAGMVAMLIFLNAAMAAASQRFMSYAQGEGNTDKQKNIFNVSVLLHFLIAIAVVLLLEVVGYFLFENVLDIPQNRMEAAKYVFQFMVVSTFFTIISVPYDAVINAHENMFFVAITGVLEAFIKLAIAIYITYTDFDKLISFGLLMAVSAIVMLLIKRIYCHRNYSEVDINVNKYFDKKLFREMGGFASWSFLGSSTSMLTNYGQGIVLNIFFGPIVNAAQAVANQVNGQLMVFANTMLIALNPLIVRAEGEGNRKLMLKASLLGCKFSFLLLVILYVPMIIEMPYIFSLWLKNVPEYTIVFCRLLLLKCLIEQLYVPLNTSINAVGNIKQFQISSSIINLFPLIFSYILFYFNQPALTTYIVFIVYAICSGWLTYYYAEKYCGLSATHYLRNVIAPCLSVFFITLVFSIIPILFLKDGAIRLLFVLFLSFTAFIFSSWFVGFKKSERLNNKYLLLNIFKQINGNKLPKNKINQHSKS